MTSWLGRLFGREEENLEDTPIPNIEYRIEDRMAAIDELIAGFNRNHTDRIQSAVQNYSRPPVGRISTWNDEWTTTTATTDTTRRPMTTVTYDEITYDVRGARERMDALTRGMIADHWRTGWTIEEALYDGTKEGKKRTKEVLSMRLPVIGI